MEEKYMEKLDKNFGNDIDKKTLIKMTTFI